MRLGFEGIVGVQPRKPEALRAQGSGSAVRGWDGSKGKLGRELESRDGQPGNWRSLLCI